jgi:hypothetical protein
MKTLRKYDPKEYWKILNTGKSTKQPDIEFKERLINTNDDKFIPLPVIVKEALATVLTNKLYVFEIGK